MIQKKCNVLIVAATFYKSIIDELIKGAGQVLNDSDVSFNIIEVPGAFELPAVVSMALAVEKSENKKIYDGYITLGCVIRGETTHYDYVCGETARALQELSTKHQLALGFGLLTVENVDQAKERAFVDRKNKGGEAAEACIKMIQVRNDLGVQSSD
jgi:6,7-dimethyl-8-ribityllumazine synthase|tara:strand:+ start:4345 stop:4812 length:468 start_codon:yes stop_codon:yes gene_type:complete